MSYILHFLSLPQFANLCGHLSSLPNTAGEDGFANSPIWVAPVLNLLGYSGAPHIHPSGFRSFPLNCTIYNPDTKKAEQFAVECFLDTSPRWAKYSPPKAGSLAHVVGNLLGLF